MEHARQIDEQLQPSSCGWKVDATTPTTPTTATTATKVTKAKGSEGRNNTSYIPSR